MNSHRFLHHPTMKAIVSDRSRKASNLVEGFRCPNKAITNVSSSSFTSPNFGPENVLRERARQFLKDLCIRRSPSERIADMVYGLSFTSTTAVDPNSVGNDRHPVEDVQLMPMTDVMRAQLEHASKIGRYNYRHAKLFQEGNAVLDHTWEEEQILEAVAVISPQAQAEIANVEKVNHKTSLLESPKTFQEALLPSDQARVITETCAPFRITHVNSAWENLCGFSLEECKGKSLSLIQGPETDQAAITAMIYQLLNGEECGLVLTNYKKDGTMFRNRLKVAPLKDEQTGLVTHFIGTLNDLSNSIFIESLDDVTSSRMKMVGSN